MLLISCDCIVSLKFVQSNDLFTKRANCGIFFCIKETSSSIIEERPSPATEIFFRKRMTKKAKNSRFELLF